MDNPEKKRRKEEEEGKPKVREQYKNSEKYINSHNGLNDFYSNYDPFEVSDSDLEDFEKMREELEDWERSTLDFTKEYAVVTLTNIGGLVTPVILEITFEDGSKEEMHLPPAIWRRNPKETTKLIVSESPVVHVMLDPHREMADTNRLNNQFPQEIKKKPFGVSKSEDKKNPMQKEKEAEEKKEKKDLDP